MSVTIPAIEADYAYRECARITRRQAANFFYGIRLLPPLKRDAMSAVYAFARRVDDIGDDGTLERTEQLSLLAGERLMLTHIQRGDVRALTDPVSIALAHAHARFEIPIDALEQLIDGVEADVVGARYETFDELVFYCRCVAGSIGRMCVAIFTGGSTGENAGTSALADDLGVAMQLTNILRDVREDHEQGRRYLPGEDLRRFGCEQLPDGPADRAADLIRFEAARAEEWFARGMRLIERLDSRSGACVLAMTGIYRSILRRIVAEPEVVLHRRISLPAWEKVWLAAQSLGRAGAIGRPR